jgi:hypothetical protein
VHRRLGQFGVVVRGGDGCQGGEHVEGESSVRKGIEERGEPAHLVRHCHQRAGRAGAEPATVAQPGRHGESAVAAEGFGGAELGDVAQHGVLMHRNSPLVGLHALGQGDRTGVAAPVTAERTGAKSGRSSAGRRGMRGSAGRHGASMREGCDTFHHDPSVASAMRGRIRTRQAYIEVRERSGDQSDV